MTFVLFHAARFHLEEDTKWEGTAGCGPSYHLPLQRALDMSLAIQKTYFRQNRIRGKHTNILDRISAAEGVLPHVGGLEVAELRARLVDPGANAG